MLLSRALRGVSRVVAQTPRLAVFSRNFSASCAVSVGQTVENKSQDQVSGKTAETQEKSTEKGDRDPKNSKKRHILNRKVRDISTQVKQSVNSASGAEIGEAIDILEEGIAYLREIQESEKIPDELLYSVFQPITLLLFDKIVAPDAQLGPRSVEQVLDLLISQRIAHNYHFVKTAEFLLQNKPNLEGFTQVLQLWLQYLEYVKEVGIGRMSYTIKSPFGAYKERNFDSRDLQNLSFFAYVSHCLQSGVEYTAQDAMKLLQITDISRIPERFHVTGTLRKYNLECLNEYVLQYEKKVNDLNIKAMDPNGAFVTRRIDTAITQNNPGMLHSLFEQMKTASVTNKIAISEATFNRIMNGFIELHRFEDVVDIFRNLLAAKGKPSVATWDLVIKAMGHPSNVKNLSGAEKKKMVENVENTVRTMIALGISMNARTLAVVIGAFANLNRFDLVDKFLAEFSEVPVVHLAKNNILLGLASNRKIAEAEQKLKEFLAQDAQYKPSTAVMNSFLAYYVGQGNDKAVEGIITHMKENGIEENVATITTFISYYFKMYRAKGMVPDVTALLANIKNSMPYNQFTATTIVDGLAKDGVNLEAARSVFEHFCKENSRFKYNVGLLTTMIKAELDFGSVHSAEELFEFYVQNLRNDTRIWNMMIESLLPKQEKLAVSYYNKLLAQAPFNVKPNYYTYYYMLDHFTKTGNTKRVQWTLDEILGNLTELGNALPRMILRLNNYQISPELKARITKL